MVAVAVIEVSVVVAVTGVVVVEINPKEEARIKVVNREERGILTSLLESLVSAPCISDGGVLLSSVRIRGPAHGKMSLPVKIKTNETGTSPILLIHLTICTQNKFRKYKLFIVVKLKSSLSLSLSHLVKRGGVNLYKCHLSC